MLPLSNYIFCAIIIAICIPIICGRGNHSLEIRCIDDSDCVARYGVNKTKCIHSACVCIGKTPCEPQEERYRITVIGGQCIDDVDCNINNTLCQMNVCECMPDLVVSADNRSCLKVSGGLLQTCDEDIQCLANVDYSICGKKGRCECDKGFHKDKFKCWKDKELGDSCNANQECLRVKFAVCGVQTCQCDDKHVANKNNTHCLNIATDAGSSCREDSQCMRLYGEGAACLGEEVCGCNELYSLINNTECVKNSRLKLSCETHEDCRDLNGNLVMSCEEKICECVSPYYEREDVCISGAWTPSALPILIIFAIIMIMQTKESRF